MVMGDLKAKIMETSLLQYYYCLIGYTSIFVRQDFIEVNKNCRQPTFFYDVMIETKIKK